MKKLVLLCFLLPLLAQNPPFTHNPINTFNLGDKISFWVTAKEKPEVVLFFYKVGKLEYFQVRKMENPETGKYYFELDSRRFTDRFIKYHFLARIKGKYIRLPKEGEFEARGLGELAKVPPEEKAPPIKPILAFNGNLQWQYNVKQKEELPADASRSTLNGNLSVRTGAGRGNSSLKLNSTVNYIKGEEKPANLSYLYAGFTNPHHTIEVGDLSFQAPDLAMISSGRRGIRYALTLNKISGSAFVLSTRQLSGLGVPSSESQYHGANLSFSLGTFKLHGLILSGKDNPQEGTNSSDLQTSIRKGSIISVGFSAYLFQNRVNLSGDYFSSSYDDNITDEEGAKKDSAYTLNGSFSKGIFSFSTNYKKVGANYNSVASSFITNNMENLSSNLSLSFSSGLSLSGSFLSMNSNIVSIEGSPKSTNKNYSASLNYSPGKFSLGLGYQMNRQKTEYATPEEATGLPTEINSGQFTVNLGFTPSSSFSLQITGGSSLNKGIDEQKSYSFGLNMNANISGYFMLTPSLNYIKTVYDGQTTKNLSAFVSYYLTLIPKGFALSGSSSFTQTKTPDGTTDTKTLMFSSKASLLLPWIWSRLGQSAISIEGQFTLNSFGDTTTTDWKVLASAEISF